MSRQLVYLPADRRDFVEARNYYGALFPRLAEAFRAEFQRAERSIAEGLITHKLAFRHYHRVLLQRYSYTLYYRVAEHQAVIVGLLYARLAPENIQATLTSRES